MPRPLIAFPDWPIALQWRLAEASITPLSYHDIAGTCGHDQGCRCGVCWVRKDMEARGKPVK